MSLVLRVKNPTGTLPKNIILSGKGVSRVKGAGTEQFDRCPIEDYSNQGVKPSSLGFANDFIDVWVGNPNGANAIQTLTASGVPASGAYRIKVFNGKTASLAWNATSGQITEAIRSIINPYYNTPVEVSVTGSLATGLALEFVGKSGLAPIPAVEVVNSTLQTSAPAAITVAVAQTQLGVSPLSNVGPDLNLSGVYQLDDDHTYVSAGGNTIAYLKPVETVRNANS